MKWFTASSLSLYCVAGFLAAGSLSSVELRKSSALFREQRLEEKVKSKRSPAEPVYQPRIVGGDAASSGEFPWMVALLDQSTANRYYAQYCGASLIHPYWVLTAAHCVEGDSPENIDALAGGYDLDSSAEGERIPVAEIIIHPDYDPVTLDCDVALLRLESPSSAPTLRLNSDVAMEMPDTVATVLGWGALSEEGGSFPSILQEVLVPLVSLSEANAPGSYDGTLTDNMLAAGNLSEGGVDSCQGDSGGPLVVWESGQSWVLAGITSFGEGCAQPSFPGIYTRVSQMRTWAMRIISPAFAAWEVQNQTFGETRDPDNDSRSNLYEFAFFTDPAQADNGTLETLRVGGRPVVRFSRSLGAAGELVYGALYKADLLDEWLTLSIEDELLTAETTENAQTLTLGFPSGDTGFMVIEAGFSGDLLHAPRPLGFPGVAHSTMTSEMQFDQFGRPYQEFQPDDLPIGEAVNFTARSEYFDVRLELYDTATGALVDFSGSDNAGGTDERVSLSTDVPLTVRVLAEDPAGRGGYTLAVYPQDDTIPSISGNETVIGELTSEDELDPLWLPNEYYKEDFRLEFSGGSPSSVTATLYSNEFDAYLEIIDEESGEIIAENDDIDLDAGNYNARVTFTPGSYANLLIRVTTAAELETGQFTLVTESN